MMEYGNWGSFLGYNSFSPTSILRMCSLMVFKTPMHAHAVRVVAIVKHILFADKGCWHGFNNIYI